MLAIPISIVLSAALPISHDDAITIGRRVWQNECGGTVSGLTSWNPGETFASLGIGHFIWYPAGERGPFDESFPRLLAFVSEQGGKLPQFLRAQPNRPCPWNSRAEFERARDSADMKELRSFLVNTIDLQAEFLVFRLQNSLTGMLAEANPAERDNIQHQFARVGAANGGYYALVDYVNFKGEGTLRTERYGGEGWGLLQVLSEMHGSGSQSALDEFADSAKTVLRRRVANSPPARGESRWLPGWLARVDTYRTK